VRINLAYQDPDTVISCLNASSGRFAHSWLVFGAIVGSVDRSYASAADRPEALLHELFDGVH